MDGTVVSSKDAETSSAGMTPYLKRLCVTVRMLLLVAGNRELIVRSTGPMLQDSVDVVAHAHPKIPSRPSRPLEAKVPQHLWIAQK